MSFYAPGDQARIDEAFLLAVEEGRPYDSGASSDHRQRARDLGPDQWAPGDRGRRVVRLYGDIQDITEQRAAKEELRVAHERVRRLFDANIMGNVFVARPARFLEANDYFLDLIGRTRAELERGELDWRRPRLLNGCPPAITRSARCGQLAPQRRTRRSTCARTGPVSRYRSRPRPSRA